MSEFFTYGSVGGAPGNRCFYPEPDAVCHAGFQSWSVHGAGELNRSHPLTRITEGLLNTAAERYTLSRAKIDRLKIKNHKITGYAETHSNGRVWIKDGFPKFQ